MKPPRSASFQFWQLGFVASACLFAHSAPLFAASTRLAKAPAKVQTGAPRLSAARLQAVAHPDFADALPTARPAAPDLLLARDAERKADAFAYFSQGVLAEDNSDADAELTGYRKALELDPANTELAVRVALLLTQRDDPSGAIQVLKDTIKAAPKEPLPLVYLSQIYIKSLKKPDLGLKYAEQALVLDPNYFPATVAVFELLVAENQTGKAEQLLQRAAKATSTDARFWLSLGDLFTRIHIKEDGSPDSPDSLKQANTFFRKAAELGKDNAALLARVGNYFIDTRQLKEAIPYFSQAIALKPDSADDPILANAKEKLARALTATGNSDEAIKVLEEITKNDALGFQMFEFLGELYEEKGDWQKALENYQHSLLLDSGTAKNHVHVAELQMSLKHFDDAVATAKAALARFPNEPETHYLMAITLSQAKHHQEAMAAFAEAKSEFENDGHGEYLNAAFYFSYGATAEQAGLLDQAAELLRKSIDLDPSNAAQAYNYLGYMWADRGEHLDEAGDLIRKAVAQDPDNGAYLDSLGWFYYKKGDYDRALTEMQKAVEATKPEDATVYNHLGDVYQKLDNTPEALRYWQKAIALHQDDLDNQKVAEKIEAAKQKVTSTAPPPSAPKAQ